MKPSVFGLFLASATLIAGCKSTDTGLASQSPRRDEWKTVINQPFPWLNSDGETVDIGSITIGGETYSDNFANRGDIIVRFAETDFITVRMRRFTMAADDEIAEDDFDALEIWAYDASGNPRKPADMDPEANCRDPGQTMPWRNDCRIRVYYEGQTQLGRSGADLEVTLPASYIGEINVTTEDNDIDSDYHNRGNVCVENLSGSADIALGNGSAYVIIAPNASIIPFCPADQQATCVMEGWNPETCPCLGGTNPYTFASTKVTSHDAAAADITVDIPPTFWAAVNLTNEGDAQMKGAAGNMCADGDGTCCDATVDPNGFMNYLIDPSIGDEFTRNPWRNAGSINYPGDPAVNGAGYNIQLTSKECQAVTATEDPEDFVGKGLGTDQETAERGNLKVCTGCLRTATCEDLLPGSF